MYTKWAERECVIVWLCNSLSHSLSLSSRISIFKRLSNRFYYYSHTLRELYYIWNGKILIAMKTMVNRIFSLSLSTPLTPIHSFSLSLALSLCLSASLAFVLSHFVVQTDTQWHIERRANMTHWWAFTVIYIQTERATEKWWFQWARVDCTPAMNK